MADRLAVILCWVDAQKGDEEIEPQFAPFDSDDFWHSAACWEIRTLPIYQEALEEIRTMVG